jgi:hypothetical protein
MQVPKPQWWRAFDHDYWQMRSALGYPIPHWADKRFRLTSGPMNPHQCGMCEARKRYPGLHVASDIRWFRDHLMGADRQDFEHRIGLALHETSMT